MNPYILKGLGQGLNRASETLLNVSLQKQQLEKQNKEFDLGMKMKKLQLEALEDKMSPEQLDYNKAVQGLEVKQQKIKTEAATLELDKARREAEFSSAVLDSYTQGLERGEVDQDILSRYDISAEGEVTRLTPEKQLKREEATEELEQKAGARQPLDTKIPQPTKGGWFGIGAKDVNEATTTFAKGIQTRQDLINMIKNAEALGEQGVDISQIEDLYEDELLKLATEGYLSEK